MSRIGLAFLVCVACGDGADTAGGGGGDGSCTSSAGDIPQDLKSAIHQTCGVAVGCDAWTCTECVQTFEDSYRGLDSYSQATYADAVLCLSTIECPEWRQADFSECTGNECGGVWCGSDDGVCAYYGCGTCQGDGYCG